jgi:hypothetical protein
MNSRIAVSVLMVLSIMIKESVSFQTRSINFVQPLIQQGLSSTIDAMRKNLMDTSKVYQPPQNAKSKRDFKGSSALVFVPGCSLNQYESLVQSKQQQSGQNLWVVVPSVPMGAANPLTIRHVIKDSIEKLRKSGYSRENIFLGGHSLGAAFLPSILDEFKNKVAGLVVMLGSFVTRDTQNVVDSNKVSTLTACGELDGLVQTSRIAESYHHAITSKGDTDKAKLNNPVVLIEGMNHFQYVNGEAPYMKRVRDLKAEIDNSDALEAVGSTLAQFVDYHSRAGAADRNTVPNDQVRRALLHPSQGYQY